MDTKHNYYEILGVNKNSSQDEIKSAYRKLCREYHPDIAKDKQGAEEKFKEINEAYSVLGDEEKRRNYDQFGSQGLNINMGDFMNADSDFGFGGLGSIFDMFGFGSSSYSRQQSRNMPRRGGDMRYDLEINLEEAFSGCKKDIEIETKVTCGACKGTRSKNGAQPIPCGTCGGTGQVTQVRKSPFGQIVTQTTCMQCRGEGVKIKEYCDVCGGSGKVSKLKTLTVDIPAGVDTGSKIRIAGEGEGGYLGGESGDLYIFIFIRDHAVFQRSGKDLYKIEYISFPQAALGTELNVETIDGSSKLQIPSGTQCDTTFKIKGKGMPAIRGDKGDLFVKIWIKVPQKLNDRQKQALEDFEDASTGKTINKKTQEKDPSFFEKIEKNIKKALNKKKTKKTSKGNT